ncbi:MAG: LacI family DNA-binding transcriptional regulator [Candidatus Vecturithrix sp.]|jgi:LacI family transcriptional regulator|nr:LacI family DNA-binding transcriptional regulator [Candidatus Vecturithrix sp.]
MTIRDLAKLAGVSVATVSRSLNDSPLVQEATKQKILKLADEMGFELNAIARGLATSKVNTIGVILPVEYDQFGHQLYYSSLLSDLRGTLERANYDIIVTFSTNRFTGKSNILSLVNRRKVDGLIILQETLEHELLDFLEKKTVPYIFSHYPPSSEDISVDAVYPDHLWGGKLAGEHLASLRCRRMMCISAENKVNEFVLRVRGFARALTTQGLDFSEEQVLYVPLTFNDGYRIVREHASVFQAADAVFVVTDLLAFGVIAGLKDIGLAIPQDISVVGYDDIPLAAMLKPTLTTVHQPREEIAKKTCRRLIEKIQHPEKSLAKIKETIRPYLVVRETSQPLSRKK